MAETAMQPRRASVPAIAGLAIVAATFLLYGLGLRPIPADTGDAVAAISLVTCLSLATLVLAYDVRVAMVLGLAALAIGLVVPSVLAELLLYPIPVVVGFAVAQCPRALATAAVVIVLVALVLNFRANTDARIESIVIALAVAVAAGIGALIRSDRQRREAEQARHRTTAADLERAHVEHAAALHAQRLTIARELHDIVAHGVNVMVAQAQAALFDGRPISQSAALEVISSVGREAIDDLRDLLGVLRADQEDEEHRLLYDPDTWSVGDLDTALAGLGDRLCAAGHQVAVQAPGSPMPVRLATLTYRVAQEATTNVLKYAAVPSTVDLTARAQDGSLRLVVEDRPLLGAVLPPPTRGSGLGLIGMSERVRLACGTIAYGRTEEAGFRVTMEIPLEGADTNGVGEDSGSPG